MVVDDNDTSRRILAEMLQSWELVPTGVSRARVALETLCNTDGSSPRLRTAAGRHQHA